MTRPPEEPQPTDEMRQAPPGPAEPPLVDLPTEQVSMPAVHPEPTTPLAPVDARHRRTAILVTALVLLVLAVMAVAVLVWG